MSKVYLERLLTYAEIDIHASNWKRILLGAILLSSKVWDDQAGWLCIFVDIIMYLQLQKRGGGFMVEALPLANLVKTFTEQRS